MIFFVPLPDTTTVVTVKCSLKGTHTIDSLQKAFQNVFNDGLNGLIEQNKRDKKFDSNHKFKKIKNNSFKICIEKGE